MVHAITEMTQVNGVPAEVTLSADGELRWHLDGSGEQSLAIESEVLGFSTEGRKITVRAYVSELRGGEGELGKRVRKDFVLEMPTEVVAESWSERIRDFINSLGDLYAIKDATLNLYHRKFLACNSRLI